MRNPLRGRWPTGMIGMLGLVLAVELYVARRDRDFSTLWAQTWKWSGEAAAREAARGEILCFGDSLVLHGVVPNVIEGRLKRTAYNLAVYKGQAASSYFLLRRALAAGARPAAVLVDGELLDEDPTELTRLWPELASLYDCAELARAARSPGFFGTMAVSKLLPSYKARWEVRASVLAAIEGKSWTSYLEVRTRRRNAEQNLGAQVLPAQAFAPGQDPRAGLLAEYRPAPWKVNPLNAVFVDRFLALAGARGIPVFWLLPPYHPGVQAGRERGGWDAAYTGYVKGLQARFRNLGVIDGRHAGYQPEALSDMTHLNRLGAVAFSDAVAGVLATRLGHPAPAPRWVAIPAFHPPADAPAIEDVVASTEALKRQYAGRQRVRR